METNVIVEIVGYGKLVRDRVHLQIMGKGEYCLWHVAAPDELPKYLLAKLKEEVGELIKELDNPTRAAGEIADVLEVVFAIAEKAEISEKCLWPNASEAGETCNEQTLLNSLAPFGNEFGDPDILAKNLRNVVRAVYPFLERSVQNCLQVFREMRIKRQERGGFRNGIILDEAEKTG